MTWPLLDELRALATEDGCLEAPDDIREMEFRITDETGVGRLDDDDWIDSMPWVRDWDRSEVVGCMMSDAPPPFLGSSDAAALLEEELVRCLRSKSAGMSSVRFSHTWWPLSKADNGPIVVAEVFDLPDGAYGTAWAKTEPVARTLAVMGAGHEIGIWPIRKDGGGDGS